MTSDDFTAVCIVALVMFAGVMIVVPAVWFNYRTKSLKLRAALGSQDSAATQGLWDTARRMEERIGYLETVLDTEVPGWRGRSERS
jgi:phage shock protein B